MTSTTHWQPDGEPYCLLTLAITAPGTDARLLIDQVSPEQDARQTALNHLAVLANTSRAALLVRVVAKTEFIDLVPTGTSPTPAQENS